MFSGKAYHSVDAKGRLFIPAMYREELGNKFIVARGFSEPYLIVYPEREWESLITKIDEMGLEKNARQIKRYIMLTANPTEMDSQGRIVLSKEHREYANFIKDVTVVGMGSTIEIWANEELVNQTEQPPENLEEFLATIK